MNNKLAAQTQKTAGIPNGMRTATIAAVSGSAITISVSGGQFSSGVGVLGSYAPVVGDTVAVFRQDSSWLILGSVSAAGNGGRVGTAMVTANSGNITTITQIASLTVNLVTGRTYALHFSTRASSGTVGDMSLGRIRVDGGDLNVNGLFHGITSNGGLSLDIYAEYNATATGPKTFSATMELYVGTGPIVVRASQTGATFFYCDYIPGGGIYQ